jgi:hypothetical protein
MQIGSWKQRLYKTGISNSKDVLRLKAQNVGTTNKKQLMRNQILSTSAGKLGAVQLIKSTCTHFNILKKRMV